MEKQLRDELGCQEKRRSVIKTFYEAISLVNIGSKYCVTEMQKADKFLRYLQKLDEIHFYVEFSNGDKFADVYYDGIDDGRMILYCADPQIKVLFRFESLTVQMPDPEDDIISPVLLFEAGTDLEILTSIPQGMEINQSGDVEVIIEDGKLLFDSTRVEEIKRKKYLGEERVDHRIYYAKEGLFAVGRVNFLPYDGLGAFLLDKYHN